jgi:hypothetical protein
MNNEFTGPGWDTRVAETATHVWVDLFGTYTHTYPVVDRRDDRLLIPLTGLNDPIPREEAVALLYNAVIFVQKVDYDRAADRYNVWQAGAGLGGHQSPYIAYDIGLYSTPNTTRDRYGRPTGRYREWEYRGRPIYNHPLTAPQMVADWKGSEVGNTLRTTLTGVATRLELIESRVFINSNQAQADNQWYVITPAGVTAGLGASGTVITQAQYNAFLAGDGNPAFYSGQSAYDVLDRYLTQRLNMVAFGPSATVEVYRIPGGRFGEGIVDIVIIIPYLAQLTTRIHDDLASIFVDESALRFNLYVSTPTSVATVQVTEFPRTTATANTRARLMNFTELHDNAPLQSWWFATPYLNLTWDGRFVLAPRGDANFNEVYAPSREVLGRATGSGATHLIVGTTRFDMALNTAGGNFSPNFSPTVRPADRTNNYTFFLDEDDVIVGSVYARPGEPGMGGFLWLRDAYGDEGTGSIQDLDGAPWANGFVAMGTGYDGFTRLPTRGFAGTAQFWNPWGSPSPTWADFGTVSTAADGNHRSTFYAYTGGPDSVVTMRNISGRLLTADGRGDLWILDGDPTPGADTPTIRPGVSRIGSATVGGTVYNFGATPRTILTYVAGGGTQSFTGFARFPDLTGPDFEESVTLIRLEPGNPNAVAEILFINLDETATAVGAIRYAYLMEAAAGDVGGVSYAYFVHSDSTDGAPERLNIVNPAALDENNTRFYVLLREGANWRATPIRIDADASVGGGAQVLYAGILASVDGAHFALEAREAAGGTVTGGYMQTSAGMRVYRPARNWGPATGEDERLISTLNDDIGRLVVVIEDLDISAGNAERAMVAFSFHPGLLETIPISAIVTGIVPSS